MTEATTQPDRDDVAGVGPQSAMSAGDSVGIICGGGSFPAAVASAIARSGRRPVMFGIKGWADTAIVERYAHHWIAIGQLGRFIRLAAAERCQDVLLIGTLLRPPLMHIRLDWTTFRAMPRIARHFRGGDDRLLSGVVELIEEHGLRVIGVKDVAPQITMPTGVLGRHQPSARDYTDIALAFELIATLGPFDVGQAAIVADNHVLAIEGVEGTDNLLARVAALREQSRVATPRGVGVLVKAPKPAQDRRFDLPAIGLQTVAGAARAGLAGIAVAAGETIIADAAAAIETADRAGIFLVGVEQERR
jgi:UDP-2,3-diacylglucosamine hydrolase